jgi:hypothetical protein
MPHSTYLPEKMGSAIVSPTGSFEAGSYEEFTVTYTAGYFGIDDTGSIKVVHRFASDMGRPQFDNPSAPNYTTVEATNGAILHIEYDMKRNIRPWDKTLYIKVVRGYLEKGDQIVIRFGDRRQGCPGIRLQTFCEDTFEFRVLVDAIATYNYVELPEQPTIRIVPGPPVLWKAVLPTQRLIGDVFNLKLKAEDKWGNPSNLCDQRLGLRASMTVAGLPDQVTLKPGEFSAVIEELQVSEPGDLRIDLLDDDGQTLASSNPLRLCLESGLLPYWGELHGQSEETIGTNSARQYFEFARDKAFIDVCVHQGNDFQITQEFWRELNELTQEFNQDGAFITIPGYEWSGNTGLGGDRNVLFREEGRQIHRSSHALVDDLSDLETDANSAEDLFQALKHEDCVVFAHIGGRYADIKMAHDIRIERSVEVHSAWGTFEWLIHDAFEQGYRVGILSNSDGHKGRPAASHPGASKFGSYGGLSCLLAKEFTRDGIMDALRLRHHYGTTGCRMLLDTRARFDSPAQLFDNDPNLGDSASQLVTEAMMGDILHSADEEIEFTIDLHASSAVERIEIRNGLETIETWRPFDEAQLGSRIRVIWEGSEYRGRGRETIWNGFAELSDNSFQRVIPINRYNIDARFEHSSPTRLDWQSITTGGFGGFDAWLDNQDSGSLKINTDLVKTEIPISSIGLEDLVFEAGGIGRCIRVFRMPDSNKQSRLTLTRRLKVRDQGDNAYYVRVTQEDGHYIWSSPIYVIQKPGS